MKLARILLLAAIATALVFAAAYMYGWMEEMSYTEHRMNSIDRANEALHRGESDPNRHIIRPPAEDRTYYK